VRKAISQGRDLPLQFVTAKMIMRMTRGHCPCHDDRTPSFSAKPGREPGTTVVACGAGCSQDDLLAYFRKRGWRLGPMATPKGPKGPVKAKVITSVAYGALTRSEVRMYGLIAEGHNPTYNDFVAAGVARKAIPGGIRALQALGLIGVNRRPRRKGCQQYEQNEYWAAERWVIHEPETPSKGALRAAIAIAKERAKAARRGGEDISEPLAKAEASDADLLVSEVGISTSRSAGKTERGKMGSERSLVRDQALRGFPRNADLRISEVPPRGRNRGTESYVVRSLASLSQDSLRPTNDREVPDSGGGDDNQPVPPPLPEVEATPLVESEISISPSLDLTTIRRVVKAFEVRIAEAADGTAIDAVCRRLIEQNRSVLPTVVVKLLEGVAGLRRRQVGALEASRF
jgi:hypothetical protein